MKGAIFLTALLALCAAGGVTAQPTYALPGQPPVVIGPVLPDNTFVTSTYEQVAVGQAAKGSYNDFDLVNFLTNTECLESIFDNIACFGVNLHPDLFAGGPAPIGGRRANVSDELLPFCQETARDEAGHVRFIRSALGDLASPCPLVNLTAFSTFFANAFGQNYSTPFDPFANDVNLFLAIWSLEEIGSTGDKGVSTLVSNATLRDAAAGLAVSAGYQAAAQRFILWERRDEIVQPFNVTVAEVVAKISAYRDSLDGPPKVDQGLFFDGGINIVPTDGNGLTFSRTPQQVLSILTCGAPDGRGCFFPNGVNGRINQPVPLGTVMYPATRPDTNATFWNGTGFANPNTTEGAIPVPAPLPSESSAPAPDVGAPVGAPVSDGASS